ncbi:hypothetical protein DFH08DRAFT_819378 [Mycena albidolilacea]|uniref:Uncharacterized protein n=1 Tax=Mycena albidolilacea TaxID=1033008 RepID=A0AAD7EGN0_9AGAR|nr:hypothetical protein DFH08DRAFT_819378 [Mycena albidolilacea]
MAPCGNKGHFHGAPLDFLNGYITQYISTAANAKKSFWTDFFLEWDEKYPTLESTEQKELEEEEENYQAEIDRVKTANTEEVAKQGHCKAAIQPHPVPSKQLSELRAHAADRGKLKSWSSNAKTKQQSRKVKPFRAWLAGWCQRYQVLWQDAGHGEILRIRYREMYKKEADDKKEDRSSLDAFEKDGGDSKDGDGLMRRRHAEAISQRALDSMCAQMQCKGIVLLGEIVDGDDDEVFLSMVQQGTMLGHPEINFTTEAPLCSKTTLQVFADFLVACKKEEKGTLGSLTDTGPPASRPPALCTQCMGSLIPLPPSAPTSAPTASAATPAAPAAPSTAAIAPAASGAVAKKTSTQGAGRKTKRSKRRRGKEEPEPEESGAEDDKGEWPGGGGSDDELEQDPFTNEEEEEVQLKRPANMALQNSLAAMKMPEHNYRIHTLNALSDAEYDRENNVARRALPVGALQCALAAARGTHYNVSLKVAQVPVVGPIEEHQPIWISLLRDMGAIGSILEISCSHWYPPSSCQGALNFGSAGDLVKSAHSTPKDLHNYQCDSGLSAVQSHRHKVVVQPANLKNTISSILDQIL